jgi:hypothetical protein
MSGKNYSLKEFKDLCKSNENLVNNKMETNNQHYTNSSPVNNPTPKSYEIDMLHPNEIIKPQNINYYNPNFPQANPQMVYPPMYQGVPVNQQAPMYQGVPVNQQAPVYPYNYYSGYGHQPVKSDGSIEFQTKSGRVVKFRAKKKKQVVKKEEETKEEKKQEEKKE